MEAIIIVVENDEDHANAIDLITDLMSATQHVDIARLNAQVREVEAYESKRWPREAATVPDILHYLMEQHNLTRDDLAPLFGGAARVSEALNSKRPLSMRTIKNLRAKFGIPADLLISQEINAAA